MLIMCHVISILFEMGNKSFNCFRYIHSVLAAILSMVCQRDLLRIVPLSPRRGGHPLLDRLLQFDVKSADLRLLQQRFPRGVQKHITVRFLFVVSRASFGSELHRPEEA